MKNGKRLVGWLGKQTKRGVTYAGRQAYYATEAYVDPEKGKIRRKAHLQQFKKQVGYKEPRRVIKKKMRKPTYQHYYFTG